MEKLTYAVGFSFTKQTSMQGKSKIIIIILIFFSLTGYVPLTSHGQNHPSFVSLQSGVSIPFGGYKSTVLYEGSFTQPGFNVTFEGAWFFSKHFGAGLSAGLNLHPVDVSALGRAHLNTNLFLIDLTIRSEPFRIITVMPGLFAGFQLSEKLFFNAKIFSGLLYGKTPYQLYKPEYYLLPDDWMEITSSRDYKISWQIGTSLLYKLSPCIGISLNAGLVSDQLQFTFNTAQGSRTDKRKIGIVNVMPGINIML